MLLAFAHAFEDVRVNAALDSLAHDTGKLIRGDGFGLVMPEGVKALR